MLSEYPLKFMFATFINENEVKFMFRSFAIDKSGTHARENSRAGVWLTINYSGVSDGVEYMA